MDVKHARISKSKYKFIYKTQGNYTNLYAITITIPLKDNKKYHDVFSSMVSTYKNIGIEAHIKCVTCVNSTKGSYHNAKNNNTREYQLHIYGVIGTTEPILSDVLQQLNHKKQLFYVREIFDLRGWLHYINNHHSMSFLLSAFI